MATKHTKLRVVGLHKVPFDQQKFEVDLASIAGADPDNQDEWREQVRENWDNAWLVVVEFDGPAKALDFGKFAHRSPGPHVQAAWNEQVISTTPHQTRAGFYLHYVDPQEPLWYRNEKLEFPEPTPATPEILDAVPYGSPD